MHYHVGAAPSVEKTIAQVLIPQAEAGWIDLVAFGTYSVGGGPDIAERWWYDPASQVFVSDAVGGPVTTPEEIAQRAAAAKKAGRKFLLVRVERDGITRFVALPAEAG